MQYKLFRIRLDIVFLKYDVNFAFLKTKISDDNHQIFTCCDKLKL